MPRHILIFAVAGLSFLVGLVLVYRQRLRRARGDEYAIGPTTSHQMESAPAQAQPQQFPVQLTVVAGMRKGKTYRLLVAERATLGRAGSCELVLDDDVEISSQHAMLLMVGGKLMVRDLNSTNGTLINGVPIHNDYPLRAGDLLLLGRTELRIEY